MKSKKNQEKLISPSERAGVFDIVVGTAADAFLHHGIPWMAKKSVEMGHYRASELMRNKNLQKKLRITESKTYSTHSRLCWNSFGSIINKVRPDIKYKTDRPELDGRAIDIHKWIGKLPRPKAGFTPSKYKYMGHFRNGKIIG